MTFMKRLDNKSSMGGIVYNRHLRKNSNYRGLVDVTNTGFLIFEQNVAVINFIEKIKKFPHALT